MNEEKEGRLSREAELIEKYRIDLEALKKEQIKLAKNLDIRDTWDFNNVENAAGIDSDFEGNKILATVVVLDNAFEINEQAYASGKLNFPYISGFRAYREMPMMLEAFNKLEEKPDVVFIKGHGITHPRLGLASHFSLIAGVPTIGIAEQLLDGEIKGDNIVVNGKIVGKVLFSKLGSKPLYVSPGNLISVASALELAKRFIKSPHKIPEPLHLAGKYGNRMRKELFSLK